MAHPRRYKLLKDISTFDVEAKAGCIGIEKADAFGSTDSKVWFDSGRFYYRLSTINTWENWFELIKEEAIQTEERITVNIGTFDSGGIQRGRPHQYELVTSRQIPKEKIYSIRAAIEKILNDDAGEQGFALLDRFVDEVVIWALEQGDSPSRNIFVKNLSFRYEVNYKNTNKEVPSSENKNVNTKLKHWTEPTLGAISSGDKDWEIESYIESVNNKTFTLDSVRNNSYYSNGFKDYTGGFKEQATTYKIHSARRKSDMTTWTIGEETNYGTIKSFYVNDCGNCVAAFEERLNPDINVISLEKIQPSTSKEPPFNWVVFTEDGFGFPTWVKKDWRGDDYGLNWDDTVKKFLTKTECEEFILMNKPCLSVADIAFISYPNLMNTEEKERKFLERHLKEFAKSKIHNQP